MFELQVGNK